MEHSVSDSLVWQLGSQLSVSSAPSEHLFSHFTSVAASVTALSELSSHGALTQSFQWQSGVATRVTALSELSSHGVLTQTCQ